MAAGRSERLKKFQKQLMPYTSNLSRGKTKGGKFSLTEEEDSGEEEALREEKGKRY